MEDITLVRGRWIFPDADRCLSEAAIALQGNTILELGSWELLHEKYSTAKVLGSDHHAIIPGLINAHHHSYGVPNSLHGIEDDILEPWLLLNAAKRQVDPYLRSLFSAADLLRTGVTSVLDMASISGEPEAVYTNLKSRLRAYDESGLRVALAPGASFKSFLVHSDDEAFLATLPEILQKQVLDQFSLHSILTVEDYFEIIETFIQAYQAHSRIDVWYGPPGTQWVSDRCLMQIAERATYWNTGIQIHALESFYEKLEGIRSYGSSTIQHLYQLGVLSERLSIAHGVWLTEPDLEILAETRASVSHNPSSNLRLRAGIAPLNAMLQARITVGLGMDGTTIEDNEDMFTEMRLALRLNRSPRLKSSAPTIEDIFQMATSGGAKLLLHEQEIGKLAPGYKADLVLIDLDRIVYPWIAPEANPLHVVLLRAQAGDVDTVLIDGEIVFEDGKPTRFDMNAIAQEIAAQLNAAPDCQSAIALANQLQPYLENWYSAWEAPEAKPYIALNSCI